MWGRLLGRGNVGRSSDKRFQGTDINMKHYGLLPTRPRSIASLLDPLTTVKADAYTANA